jgi:hypothetical protein
MTIASGTPIIIKLRDREPATCVFEGFEEQGIWLSGDRILAAMVGRLNPESMQNRKFTGVFVPLQAVLWMTTFEDLPSPPEGSGA